MTSKLIGSNLRSHILLYVISILSLYFISGWPARELLSGGGSGGAGLALIIFSPLAAVAGFLSIPAAFLIVRVLIRFPQLPLKRILLTSLFATAIGVVGFWLPVMLPGVIYKLRVQNFAISPVLISQSLDKSKQVYHFTLQLDNKTNVRYENVTVDVGAGFLYEDSMQSFVWTANEISPRKITLSPGVTTISDSIYLGDCSENSVFRGNPVRLEVALVYDPQSDDKGRSDYIKKELILTPKVEDVDFDTYYTGICEWFTRD